MTYSLYKPTALDYTKLVSIVYAVSLFSLGIIFPIAEALKDEWLETVYHTVFLTFTLTLSSIFLVYLLFFILRDDKPQLQINKKKRHIRLITRCISYFTSPSKSKENEKNMDETELGVKDLIDVDKHIHTNEEPSHKNRFNKKMFISSCNSFSDLGTHKPHLKSSDSLSIRSFHKSSKLLNMRCVEPMNGLLCPSSKNTKRSDYSLHSNYARQASKEQFKDLQEETESENEKDLNEAQTWINTDSFGNVFTHEGSNLFLRLGALLFGLGNLVFYALEIQAHLITNVKCSHKMRFGWIFIWMFIFVFLQTFFLFKHAKIKITKHQPLVWFGMVHLIFTNVNLWIHTMIQEIIDEYHYKKMLKLHSEKSITFNEALSEKCDTDLLNAASKYLTPFVFEYSLVAVGSISCFLYYGAIESDFHSENKNKNMIKVFSVTPNDYEHHLLQMNINETKKHRNENKVKFSKFKEKEHVSIRSIKKEKLKENNESSLANDNTVNSQKPSLSMLEASDCVPAVQNSKYNQEQDSLQKSHKGLFLGMVLLCITIVTCVVFLFSQLQHYRARAEIIYFSTDIVVHSLLLIACVLAFILTKNLAFTPKPVNTDDILLLFAAFGSITYEVINASALFTTLRSSYDSSTGFYNASTTPTLLQDVQSLHESTPIYNYYSPDPQEHNELDPFHLIRDKLQLVSACIGMLQTSVQTLLIFVSLRRYPASMTEATEMPGRGTMAFLIVGNLSAWVFRTILCKNLQLPAQLAFYGEMGCLLLVNIHLPILLFFRFHSSVCLVDIWKSAYQLLAIEPFYLNG